MDKQKATDDLLPKRSVPFWKKPSSPASRYGGLSQERGQPGLVYRWRAVTQQATTAALQQVDSRGRASPTHHRSSAGRAGTDAQSGRRDHGGESGAEKTIGLAGRTRFSAPRSRRSWTWCKGLSNGRSGPWSPSWRVWECRAASASPGALAHKAGSWRTCPQSRGYDQLLPDEVEAIKSLRAKPPQSRLPEAELPDAGPGRSGRQRARCTECCERPTC